MAQAPARPQPNHQSRSQSQRNPWLGPLVVGLAFGLGYGLTQRLISLNLGSLVRLGQPFELQPFPGTSLESLRLRFGDAAGELRGDLDLQQLEAQQAKPALQPGGTGASLDPLKHDSGHSAPAPTEPSRADTEPAGAAPQVPAAPSLPPPAPVEPKPPAPLPAPVAPEPPR